MKTLAEIQEQIAALQIQAAEIRENERVAIISEIKEKMSLYGISVNDLKALSKKGKSSGSVPVKYRDPDTGKGWTGRGNLPNWLKSAIASGKSKEDFAV